MEVSIAITALPLFLAINKLSAKILLCFPTCLVGITEYLISIRQLKRKGITMNNGEVVAQTILEQLGGRGFAMMVGMRSPMVYSENQGNVTVTIRWRAKSFNRFNLVQITLTPEDVYKVTFGRQGRLDITMDETIEDVYCDMLAPLFREKTGLETRVPRFVAQ